MTEDNHDDIPEQEEDDTEAKEEHSVDGLEQDIEDLIGA